MFATRFDSYRNSLPNRTVMTPFERQNILEPLLKDSIITKSIGLKMLTNKDKSDDLVGLLLAAGGRL